jgi:hypothetical protein
MTWAVIVAVLYVLLIAATLALFAYLLCGIWGK